MGYATFRIPQKADLSDMLIFVPRLIWCRHYGQVELERQYAPSSCRTAPGLREQPGTLWGAFTAPECHAGYSRPSGTVAGIRRDYDLEPKFGSCMHVVASLGCAAVESYGERGVMEPLGRWKQYSFQQKLPTKIHRYLYCSLNMLQMLLVAQENRHPASATASPCSTSIQVRPITQVWR